MTAPFLLASTVTLHDPGIPGCPLPIYICLLADHGRSKVLFISGMPIEGIAGITSVTVTCASVIGFPSGPATVALKALSAPAFSGVSVCRLIFAVAAVVRRTSPLLERKVLEAAGDKQSEILVQAKLACDGLLALVSADQRPTARTVLRYVAEARLFTIPDVLAPFTAADKGAPSADARAEAEPGNDRGAVEEEEVDLKSELGGWRQALEAPFDQIEKYDRYVRGVSQFDTHQGVKGLEFPRVMVIVSDEEARGFMFNYDKLFGVKEQSKTDLDNEAAGKETTITRTRRLFYVICSRAKRSLAVVYYAADPAMAHQAVIRQGWFHPDEIEVVG